MSRHIFKIDESEAYERTIERISKIAYVLVIIAVGLIAINLTSCTKSLEMPDDVYINPSEDYEEINDIEDDSEEKEPFELEERAVTFKIYSVEPLSPTDKVVGGTCMRFDGYALMDLWTGGDFKIIGKGFGSNKDSINLVGSYKANINFPVIKNVVSDTLMVISVSKFTSLVYPVLKNLSLKFVATRTINGVLKKASKSIKATSSYANHNAQTGLPSNQLAIYPNSLWEAVFQFANQGDGKGVLNTTYQSKVPLSSAYTPDIGDIVQRTGLDEQFGFIKEVGSPDATGKRKMKIWERNYKCKGAIQKKTYYYQNGAFLSNRYGESNFTHIFRQVGL